jgi:hypothetical protein
MEGQPWSSNQDNASQEGMTGAVTASSIMSASKATSDSMATTTTTTTAALASSSTPVNTNFALADGLTSEDVEEVVRSVSDKLLAVQSYHGENEIMIRTDPREEYVLVRAWRIICTRFKPIQLKWEIGVKQPQLVFGGLNAFITEPHLEFSTLSEYDQNAAAAKKLSNQINSSLAQRLIAHIHFLALEDMVKHLRDMFDRAPKTVYYYDVRGKCVHDHLDYISRTFFEPAGYQKLVWTKYSPYDSSGYVTFKSSAPPIRSSCCVQ